MAIFKNIATLLFLSFIGSTAFAGGRADAVMRDKELIFKKELDKQLLKEVLEKYESGEAGLKNLWLIADLYKIYGTNVLKVIAVDGFDFISGLNDQYLASKIKLDQATRMRMYLTEEEVLEKLKQQRATPIDDVPLSP